LFFVRLDDFKTKQRVRKRKFVATENCPWRQKLLQGEVHDPVCWAMGGVAGHAGLFGNADAVYTICKTLLQSYLGQETIFHSATVQRFWTRSKRVKESTRAMVWDTPSAQNSSAGSRFARTSVGHLAFTGCSMWIDLVTDVIGIVLCNSAYPSPLNKKKPMLTLRARTKTRHRSEW
jgi:CubicO group peptidase (beta-lactamase class C family)